jgi:hypothetical protein
VHALFSLLAKNIFQFLPLLFKIVQLLSEVLLLYLKLFGMLFLPLSRVKPVATLAEKEKCVGPRTIHTLLAGFGVGAFAV